MLGVLGVLSAFAQDTGPPVVEPELPPRLQDRSHLWGRAFGALAVNPLGVAVDFAGEARTPVMRYGGAAFNETFIGAGMRLTVTPVHVEAAARVTFQPIDILPITVEAFYGRYWESPWGVVPATQVPVDPVVRRNPLYQADEDYVAGAYGVILSPTFQIKVGKLAAFTNIQFTWMKIDAAPNGEPFVFDPFRGVVVSPTDRILDHTSAIVWEFMDGVDKPVLRVGPALRGRETASTRDVTLQAGGLVQWRPGRRYQDVGILFVVAPYVRDPDFQIGSPFVAAVFTTNKILPFKTGVKSAF